MSVTRFISTSAILAVVLVGGAFAQNRRPDSQRMQIAGELHTQLQTFAQQKILPTLRQWKAKLDGAMSAEDLATLNGLRDRAAKFHQQMMEHGKAMREAWKNEDYAALKQHRDAMKGMKDEMRAIMTELKPLAEKYKTTLQAIGEDAKPAMEGWKTEGKSIIEKWKAEHKDQLGDKPAPPMMEPGGPMMGPKGHGHGMMGPEGPMPGMLGMHGKGAAVWFMLWNGQDLPQMQRPGGQPGAQPIMPDDSNQDLD
jgi:hypothetical protein